MGVAILGKKGFVQQNISPKNLDGVDLVHADLKNANPAFANLHHGD